MEIVGHPQNQTIYVKENQFTVTLYCHAKLLHGHRLNYKWYCLDDNARKKTVIGIDNPLLKVSMSLPIHAGRRFYCEVSAGNCTVPSRVAEIKLKTGMYVLANILLIVHCIVVWIVEEPELVTKVFTGDSVELSCKAESAPGIVVTYLWFKCDKGGQVKELVEKCLDCKMVISKATHLHQGYYKCVISPEVSSRVVYVEVMTQANIKLTTQPPKIQSIVCGEELTLNCEAASESYPVTYQWYCNKERLINANRSQLVIPQVTKEDFGFYHCDVRSEYSVEVVSSETTHVQLGEFVLLGIITVIPTLIFLCLRCIDSTRSP